MEGCKGTEEEKAEQSQQGANKTSPIERTVLSEGQLTSLTREEWADKWLALSPYVDHLEQRTTQLEAELAASRTTEERSKTQMCESQQRERILIRRIATKDQEIQDLMNQIAELKASQAPGASALRSALLDPAVNLLLHRLRQEVTALKTKLEETQNELSAWKFTPDSNTGKRLMAKCRLLYQENEELGRVVSSGRLANLEGDLALQKSFSEEVKKSQSELDEFLQDLDEDVEGMQSTIYILQQELKKTKEALAEVQQEKVSVKSTPSGNVSPVTQGSGVKPPLADDQRTASCEFRTGSQTDRLTNGNHSVVCGRTSSSSSNSNNNNAVIETTTESDLEKSKKAKKAARTNHEESSSDSSEVLKLEASDLCDEVDKEVNCHKRERKRGVAGDEASSGSEDVPLGKKARRGSELSLDYNEDELCGLTNGEAKTDHH